VREEVEKEWGFGSNEKKKERRTHGGDGETGLWRSNRGEVGEATREKKMKKKKDVGRFGGRTKGRTGGGGV